MGKIVRYVIDLDNPPPRTDEQKARLKALAELPDSEIDCSDIPPLDDAFWERAVGNPFLRKRSMSETNSVGRGEGAMGKPLALNVEFRSED